MYNTVMEYSEKEKLQQTLRQGVRAMANAKINLSIDILGRRPEDGYHLVNMIMQQIPLYDKLYFFIGEKEPLLTEKTPVDDQISLATNSYRLPLNEKNLVYRAAKLILGEVGFDEKVAIYIEKHIPSGGGLGSGSADGAAVLDGLNKALVLGKTTTELQAMAARLGSDVPFLVRGGTALASGVGTELTPLPSLRKGVLLLVNPNKFLSTEKVYNALDETEIPAESHPDTELLIEAIRNQDLELFAANMKNVLELASFRLCPEIKTIKEYILASGALGAMMSGSGATVFGIYDSYPKAEKIMWKFRDAKCFAAVTPLYL